VGIFLLPEHGPGHDASGVVNAANERQVGSVGAEPAMPAAIRLQEHAFLGHTFPALAMLGRPV